MPVPCPIEPIPFPLGVSSPDYRRGCLSNESGGIDAVDLLTGDLLWTSAAAPLPLVIAGSWLLAKGATPGALHVMHVVALDLDEGGRVALESEALSFPDWVPVAASSEDVFSLYPRVDDQDLILTWHADVRYRGGAAPSARVLDSADRTGLGRFRVSLESGAVEALPIGPARRPLPFAGQDDITSHPYQRGPSWHTKPWVAHGRLAAIDPGVRHESGPLILRRWELSTGLEEPAWKLMDDGLFTLAITLDGCYVLATTSVTSPRAAVRPVDWSLFCVATGDLAGQIDLEPGAHTLSLLEGRLYYVAPAREPGRTRNTLTARELATGELLWQRTPSSHRMPGPRALRP